MRKAAWILLTLALLVGVGAAGAALWSDTQEATATGEVSEGPLADLPAGTVLAYSVDTSPTPVQAVQLAYSFASQGSLDVLSTLVSPASANELAQQPFVSAGVAVGYVTAPSGEAWVAAASVSDTAAATAWALEVNSAGKSQAKIVGSSILVTDSQATVLDGPSLGESTPYVLEWVPEGCVAAVYVNLSKLRDTTWSAVQPNSAEAELLSTLTNVGVLVPSSAGQILLGLTPTSSGFDLSGTGQGVRVDGSPLPVPGDVSDAARTPQGSSWVFTAPNLAAAADVGSVPESLYSQWVEFFTAVSLPVSAASSVLGTQATFITGPAAPFDEESSGTLYGFTSSTTDGSVSANAASVLAYSRVVPGGAWSLQVDDSRVAAATSPEWLAFLASNQVRPDVSRFPGLDSSAPASLRIALDATAQRSTSVSPVWSVFDTLVLNFTSGDADTVSVSGTLTTR